jgi:NADH-quinone oxidoreductase subunit M
MPGSSNFVGEFLILLGVFKSKLVIAVIAFSGVVGAAVYALRIFITSMQNRVGADVDSREIEWREAVGVVPLVAVILVLAFYPQFFLKRSEPTVKQTVAAAIAPPGASLASVASSASPATGTATVTQTATPAPSSP